MLYKFAIISDEAENFFREITIDADATFLDLSNAILESCGYNDSQITSFHTCSEDWEAEQQIVREDMGTSSEDTDIYIMAQTQLSELLEDEEQKLTYTYDPLADRIFFIELTEIVTGKSLKKAVCSAQRGEAPQQILGLDLDFSNIGKKGAQDDFDIDFDAYGSDGYNDDEYDPESFGIDEQS